MGIAKNTRGFDRCLCLGKPARALLSIVKNTLALRRPLGDFKNTLALQKLIGQCEARSGIEKLAREL